MVGFRTSRALITPPIDPDESMPTRKVEEEAAMAPPIADRLRREREVVVHALDTTLKSMTRQVNMENP